MKIKIYIVTYKNDKALNRNLDSLYQSDIVNHDYEITIINNHTDFQADIDRPNLRVVHNTVRPDFSTGHLSRDWNFALIDGFKDLNNPDCDIVVACQNDTVFFPNWASYIVEKHKKDYSFIQFGNGDNFMSWTPAGASVIGLWDERFCNIGYQEGDYFLRAVLLNNKNTSINDWRREPGYLKPGKRSHEREHNPIENKVVDVWFSQDEGNKEAHKESKKFHNISREVFRQKWEGFNSVHWPSDKNLMPKRPTLNSFIYYPYFEKDLDRNTLSVMKYVGA